MFHHIVLLHFVPESTAEQHRALTEALGGLPTRIPEIIEYQVHLDAGLNPSNAQVSVHATFADESGWRTYADHPDHLAVIETHIEPILESALRTQYRD